MPPSAHRQHRRRFLVVVGTAAAAGDLAAKVAANARLDDGPVRLGAGVSLRLVHNPGVAFGVGPGSRRGRCLA